MAIKITPVSTTTTTSVCTEVLFRSKIKRTKRTEYRRVKLSLDEYDIENCWRREWPPVHLVDCPRIRINNHDFMCTHSLTLNVIRDEYEGLLRSILFEQRTQSTHSAMTEKSCDSVRQAENDDDLGKSQFSYHRRTTSIFIRHLDNVINFNVFISPKCDFGWRMSHSERHVTFYGRLTPDQRPSPSSSSSSAYFFCLSILNGFTINSTDQQP